jgi:AAHS family benzoate transporter-like MFS transporter
VGRIGAVLAISGGGVLVAASLGNFINFSVWAVAAAIGVVAVLAVPRPPAVSSNGEGTGAEPGLSTIVSPH